MKSFKNGVSWYTDGKAVVDIHFPENDVCCSWCPFCRSENDLNRFWCRLTNTMLYNPFVNIASNCPIEFTRKENENNG